MSSLTILGDTSGSVVLQAPAVSGSTTITLPNTSMTVFAPQADIWVLNTTTAFSTETFLTTNLSRLSVAGFAVTGSGMTQSSGVFTFPTTGTYRVQFNARFQFTGGTASQYTQGFIYTTTDNSTYNGAGLASTAMTTVNGSTTYGGITNELFFTVTDTSLCKVKFSLQSANSVNAMGSTSRNDTAMSFLRIA
jgi:hypothetical protein